MVVAADVQDATLTGSIQGTVSSPSFGPLAGALVTASPGGQTGTTDAAGAYLLQGVPPAAVTVSVSSTPNSCFRAASAGVTVQAGITSTANFSLICRRIALNFHSSFDFEIHTINQDGSGETPLTNDTELNDLDPSWSPDGTKLAFSVSPAAVPEGQGCCIGEISVMNANGTGRVQLTTDNFADLEPAWSPDGSRIAFVSNRDGNIELYVINADGSGSLTRLTTTAHSERDPSWSPDGTKLAFDAGGKIFVMNAVPGAPQTQLAIDAFFDFEPSWSPDGARIAFFSGPGTPPGGEPGDGDGLNEIWVTNADGSGSPTQLTHNTGFDFEPDWSPDGSKIVYVSVDRFPAADGVYTMNADGTGETLLVAQRSAPDW